jgi:hypothetical protein
MQPSSATSTPAAPVTMRGYLCDTEAENRVTASPACTVEDIHLSFRIFTVQAERSRTRCGHGRETSSFSSLMSRS